jgi:hypothetical protein
LVLKEVPPWISIFRGYVGGDCSSSVSFPYPNDPNEKVFFIYGASGNLKGYAEGTVVVAGGKKSFYLTSINGARMTHMDTESVIRAFDQTKSALGVEQVVLPRPRILEKLTNYDGTYEVFKELNRKRNAVPVQYIDPEIRDEIQNLDSKNNTAIYDRADSHKKAIVYDGQFSSPRVARVETEVEQSRWNPHDERPITTEEKLGVVANLLDSGRPPAAECIGTEYGSVQRSSKGSRERRRAPDRRIPKAIASGR